MHRKAFWFFRSVFVVSAMLALTLGYAQAQITGFIPVFVDELGNEGASVIFEGFANGNIGIGTTNPSGEWKLHVVGDTHGVLVTGRIGVISQGTGDVGVLGVSDISAGVLGDTTNPNAPGVLARSAGFSPTNPGLTVVGRTEIIGNVQAVAPGNGVRGISTGGIGVGDVGVWGTSDISAGVFGNTNNPFAVGVLARSFNSSSTNPGLHVDGRITATGTKSAVVPLQDGQHILLYAEESTEVWFSDYGSVQLLDGYAHVEIDPLFLQTVNTDKKYHVFVTPEGNPNGTLYIDNKTPTSFDIREISNSANIEVSYRIVAKRKDFADERMMIQDLPGIKGERLQQLNGDGIER